MISVEIEIRKSNGAKKQMTFEEGKYSIGRDFGDIVLGDSEVSSVHGELLVGQGSCTFSDLGSTNGSFTKSGERIASPQTLGVGTEIRMGGCTLVLKKIHGPSALGETVLAPAMKQPPAGSPPAGSQDAEVEITRSPAPNPSAGPSDSARGGDDSSGSNTGVDDFVELLKWAFQTIGPHILHTALPIALLTIPVPLVVAVLGVVSFLIPAVAPLFLILVGVLTLISIPLIIAVVLVVYPVIARFMIALYRGQEPSLKAAWHEYKEDLGTNIVTTFVNTLIGGVTIGIMGVYIFQIPPSEGKTMVDVNTRSFELLKLSWQRVVLAIIGTALLFFIPGAVISGVLGFVPIIGLIIAPVVSGLISAAYVPTILLIITRIYFETRKSAESN